jgi:hypothetical protein
VERHRAPLSPPHPAPFCWQTSWAHPEQAGIALSCCAARSRLRAALQRQDPCCFLHLKLYSPSPTAPRRHEARSAATSEKHISLLRAPITPLSSPVLTLAWPGRLAMHQTRQARPSSSVFRHLPKAGPCLHVSMMFPPCCDSSRYGQATRDSRDGQRTAANTPLSCTTQRWTRRRMDGYTHQALAHTFCCRAKFVAVASWQETRSLELPSNLFVSRRTGSFEPRPPPCHASVRRAGNFEG